MTHLDVVVRVGAAAEAEAHEDAAAAQQEDSKQDVDQGGGPEGIQVEGLITVHIWVCRVLLEVRPVNRVDPDIPWRGGKTQGENKTAQELTKCHIHTRLQGISLVCIRYVRDSS